MKKLKRHLKNLLIIIIGAKACLLFFYCFIAIVAEQYKYMTGLLVSAFVIWWIAEANGFFGDYVEDEK